MNHWHVNIQGNELDLSELADIFASSNICVHREEGLYYLTADELNSLDDPSEVHSRATSLIQLIWGLARIHLKTRTPLLVGAISRIRNDGVKNCYVQPEAASLSFQGELAAVGIGGGTPVINRKESPIGAEFFLPLNDLTVQRVVILSAKAVSPWKDLYPILEIIKEDVLREGWVSDDEISRYKRTACNPATAGDDARHGVFNHPAPSNPMTEAEAKSFIESLVMRWLEFKRSQLPGP